MFGSLLPSALDNADGVENIDIRDMPPLETEETQKVQSAKGLKIMTPSQLITRLTILLAQLQAGNISNKLKNEGTRQIIYSLYSSKNLTKTIYNDLINSI